MKVTLVLAAVAVLAVVRFQAAPVAAITGTVTVESATALVGETVEIDIIAEATDPGLGAWTLDPMYDPGVVSMISCEAYEGGVCSTAFAADAGRVTGASASGLVGPTVLATFTFECSDEPGVSTLPINVEIFADATIAVPMDIDVTVEEGEIACVEPELATSTEAPPSTATPPPVPPPTGSGGAPSNSTAIWQFAAIVTSLLLAIAFATIALRWQMPRSVQPFLSGKVDKE